MNGTDQAPTWRLSPLPTDRRWSAALLDFFGQVEELRSRLEVWETTPAAVQEFHNLHNWNAAPWASNTGVYLFVGGDQVHYVGRALGSFRQRLRSHVKGGLEEKEWGKVVFDPQTTILVVPLQGDLGDWAASLEVRLQRLLKPTSGKRRG